MKKFVVAAVAAVAVGLGTAGRADAQLVYGYNNTFGGSFNTGRTVVTPGGYQTYISSYSPFNGNVQQQVYGADVLGNRFGRSYGYSPYGGVSYRNGFFLPGPYSNPFNAYSYGLYRSRYPW